MKKFAIAAVVAAVGFAGQAQAEGISNDTLAAMGLGGATVVTDAEALDVRGMGWESGNRGKKGYAMASGASRASVSSPYGNAYSRNDYKAKGRNGASGDNWSEAGGTLRHTRIKDNNGMIVKHTKVKSLHVYAGGYSSAKRW